MDKWDPHILIWTQAHSPVTILLYKYYVSEDDFFPSNNFQALTLGVRMIDVLQFINYNYEVVGDEFFRIDTAV